MDSPEHCCDAVPVPEMRVLTEQHVESLLDLSELRRALTEAMIGLSNGLADVPPRVGTNTQNGLLLAMPGYLAGVGLAAKLISLYPDNVDAPSHQGVIILFDHTDGTPVAMLDAELISGARTAGAAAIATDVMARPDAKNLTIVGGGAQAISHAKAFATLRPWAEVTVVNRSQSGSVVVAAAAREAGAAKATVTASEDLEGAIVGADVVALCTHANQPVIDAAWVQPGTHVSSVGSQAELPPELASAARVIVEWRDCVTTPPPAGAIELQHLDPASVIELGELLQDDSLGRSDDAQITIYKSTGHAVQDVAAAAMIYRLAVEQGVGSTVAV
ncbi:MAG: ornithine cyclodeaminase family protein [Acidimicrobiales bacterium]